jgi:alpha-amylase
VLIGTAGQTVLIDPAEGGGISSWDLRASRVALASVMRRRPEAYHAKLREAEAAAAKPKGNKKAAVSPHEGFTTKEAGLSKLLVYDDHERRSGLVRILDSKGVELGDFVNGEWQVEALTGDVLAMSRSAGGLTIDKSFGVAGDRLDGDLSAVVQVASDKAFHGTLELEWNLNLSGGGANPDAYYLWSGREVRHDAVGKVRARTFLEFGNRYEGVEMSILFADPGAGVEWFPVETVSNSEAGFERVYQGSCLIQRWPLKVAAGESASVTTMLDFRQTRDRAAEEVAS